MKQESLSMDDCLEDVIKIYSNMVYKLAFSQTRDKNTADDIYQEVFLRYIKKNQSLKQKIIEKLGLLELLLTVVKSYGPHLG